MEQHLPFFLSLFPFLPPLQTETRQKGDPPEQGFSFDQSLNKEQQGDVGV